ncbi:unnamed protein product [Lepeophtheirus salmonis]|uniref:(salmon louse) hypothetical protein n=1 Tax=Lepeophtheirus salmonis TaxID=72036 RepID=A0A7R8HDD4_LEPSM|nr:unnamed protein product [Lepeophtheirus salmonis]CAF3021261.1 unnamed protein product [Lepeophtheirus salmonis]
MSDSSLFNVNHMYFFIWDILRRNTNRSSIAKRWLASPSSLTCSPGPQDIMTPNDDIIIKLICIMSSQGNLKDYKLLELREICENHQLSKGGKKKELQGRIIQAFPEDYCCEDVTISEDRKFKLLSNVLGKMSSMKGNLKESSLS